MNTIHYRFAVGKDLKIIQALLCRCNLPYKDIASHLDNFILAINNETIIGSVGLEIYDTSALLRSLTISEEHRKKGIAKNGLYPRIVTYAGTQGIKNLYLLTRTAEVFFSRLGFTQIERKALPDRIQKTTIVQTSCASTAICMSKNIITESQKYPKKTITLDKQVIQ